MSELVRFDRRHDDMPEELVETVSTNSEIVGKTIRTLYNIISLLKLVPKIQDVIVTPLS
jgi:hypothetical protein